LSSGGWQFDDATLDRAAEAFENEDYVDVVIHSYRHRLVSHRETLPTRSSKDGQADGNFAVTDGTASAAHFSGRRTHRQVPNAGHNPPQEAPEAFAEAVLALARPS